MDKFRKWLSGRLQKRARKFLEKRERKTGRKVALGEIGSFDALSPSQRISFLIVGSIFLYVSYLFFTDASWSLVIIFGPISIYVIFRGIVGHQIRLRKTSTERADLTASPELVVTEIDGSLSVVGTLLLFTDLTFATLLIILYIVLEIFGALISSLS